MKKLYTILLLLVLQQLAFAQIPQPPQGISYQAVAYTTAGAPAVSQTIGVKFEIHDISATGTIIYAETFAAVTTNAQGIYSVNIGTGTATTGTFATINWAINNKFLKVYTNIASAGYVAVGTTQLMSVPYALYSGGSKNMQVVNNIAELRTKIGEVGDIIYVRYHTEIGDQGGGFFRWRTDAGFLDTSTYFGTDNNGTIIKATASTAGRWVRQYDGYINMTFFGATYGNSNQALQAAIDFAYNNHEQGSLTRGTTVFIPSGTWLIDTINLKNGVDIVGDSEDFTILTAKTASEQGTTAYMFEAPSGPFKTSMSNLKILGDRDGVPIKGCFHLKGMPGPAGDGGTWMSHFKKIEIQGFKGHGIFLEGGSNGTTPNQSIIFELCNVSLNKAADQSTCALKITGQQGQLTFLNSGFNGYNNASKFHTGHVVSIAHTGDSYSAVISFINSTIQEGDYGIFIDYAENITIDNCWFENLGVAVTLNGRYVWCRNINILNNRFANAAGYGTIPASSPNILAGMCVNITNAQATVANNFVTVSDLTSSRILDDLFISASGIGTDINPGVEAFGNGYATPKLDRSEGLMQVVTAITSNVLECKHNKTIFANASANHIKTINCTINTGETVLVRANGSSIIFDAASGGVGNIYLTNRATLTLDNGEIAGFTKIDSSTFQLTSLVKSTAP